MVPNAALADEQGKSKPRGKIAGDAEGALTPFRDDRDGFHGPTQVDAFLEGQDNSGLRPGIAEALGCREHLFTRLDGFNFHF